MLVAHCPIPLRRPHARQGTGWQLLELAYREAAASGVGAPGLSVAFDGVACMQGVVVPGWRPQPGWRFGLGARAAVQGARHWVRSVVVRGGARVQTTTVPLEVSGNLQQWSEPVEYAYGGHPAAMLLRPRAGPRGGGTQLAVSGSGLYGTRHLCRLNDHAGAVLNASWRAADGAVLCTLPPAAALPAPLGSAASLSVRVSTNGLQYGDPQHALAFELYEANLSVARPPFPASGPIGGGTVITLALAGLGPTPAALAALRADAAAQCVFNASDPAREVAVARAAAEAARAAAEAKQAEYEQAAAATLAVTQAASAAWRREQEERLLLELGALRAAHAAADGHLEQVRSNISAAATLAADGGSLRCVAPKTLRAGVATVAIALNAQQFLEGAAAFAFYDEPTALTALAPPHGPPAGGTTVALRLDPAAGSGAPSNVSCRFGEHDGRRAAVGEALAAALAAGEGEGGGGGEREEEAGGAPHASVNCTAPSAEAAGAAWALDASFTEEQAVGTAAYLEVTGENPPPLLSLGGAAEVFGGRLRLTRAGDPALSATTSGWEDRLQPTLHDSAQRPTTRHGSGSALLTLPPGTHRLLLSVEFRLVIGGGTGGLGFSVSYGGGLPLGLIGERGAGLGLRVQFLTAGIGGGSETDPSYRERRKFLDDPPSDTGGTAAAAALGFGGGGGMVRVLYDGVLLGEHRCPALRSGLLTPVRLAVSRAGLMPLHANPNLPASCRSTLTLT